MKIMKCDYCGKDVKVAPSREGYKTHFCCAKCHHKFMKKEKESTLLSEDLDSKVPFSLCNRKITRYGNSLL